MDDGVTVDQVGVYALQRNMTHLHTQWFEKRHNLPLNLNVTRILIYKDIFAIINKS